MVQDACPLGHRPVTSPVLMGSSRVVARLERNHQTLAVDSLPGCLKFSAQGHFGR